MIALRDQRKAVSISVNGEKLEQVETFKYLGTIIDSKGNVEIDIDNRIKAASNMFAAIKKSFINKKEISAKTKLTVYLQNYSICIPQY